MAGVQINKGQLSDVRRMLSGIKDGAARAEARALNRVASKAKTRGGKEIRQQVRLPAAYVRDRLTTERATWSKLVSAVRSARRGILLSYYLWANGKAGAKFNKGVGSIVVGVDRNAPVRVRVKPGGPVKNFPGGFILPRLKYSGVPGIAIRLGRGRKRGPRGGDANLKVLHGASIDQVLEGGRTGGVFERIAPDMGDELAAELDREASYLLSKYG